jgi:hypothetical protein
MKWRYTAVLAIALSTACVEGNEAKCRQAVRNIFELTGVGSGAAGPDENAAVRSCRANASAAAINCMIAADSITALQACEGGEGIAPAALPAKDKPGASQAASDK